MWSLLFWLGQIYYAIDLPGLFRGEDPEAEFGQGLVEYAMLMMLVAVVAMGMLVLLGPEIGNMFENVISNLENATD